jgi:histidyl-tRNA synthetase
MNVLRVLDCKQEGCRAIVEGLPPLTKFMAPASRQYLDDVLGILHGLGIEIIQNPRLVRGLDYYVHTVWEITHPALGAQDALSGGGRYAITFGDKTIEGVGFAMGLERVLTALEKDAGPTADAGRRRMVWLVSMGDRAFDENLKLAQSLRMRGVACGMDLAKRSMKAQMRAADRSGASQVVIRGDAEMEKGTFMLKDMAAGTQSEVAMPELMERILRSSVQ